MGLGPRDGFNSTQKQVVADSAAIQTYCSAILNQADIKIDELPDLPSYQQQARDHALKWTREVLPGINNANGDIIGFGNAFSSFFKHLMELAKKIDAGDTSQVPEFLTGLGVLRKEVSKRRENAEKVSSSLSQFKSQLEVDFHNFSTQVDTAVEELEGHDGELESLSLQISNIDSQLSTCIAVMAAGGVALLGGAVLILVGVFAEIETAGLSTGLTLAGVGLVTGGIGSEIAGGTEYALLVQSRTELQEKLAAEKQGIGILKHVKGLIEGLVSQMNAAIQSTANLQGHWASLGADIDQVVADLDDDPGSLGLEKMLNDAKQDWQIVYDTAMDLQPKGTMPQQVVDDLNDFLHPEAEGGKIAPQKHHHR